MTGRQKWIAGLAVALVVTAGVTVATVVSYTDGARPGAAFFDIGDVDSAHDGEVKLPLGTLTVRVGSPSQEFDTDFGKTTRAADGAVLVPVGWELGGAQTGVSSTVPFYQFQLTLVADGRRYDLQAGYQDEPPSEYAPVVVPKGSVAAVVEGDGSDLRVEVEYDGLTQVLDVDSGKVDTGLAAPYYATGGLRSLRTSTACAALSSADAKAFTVPSNPCSLGPVQLSPYVGGLGWVDSADESWATVPYSLRVSSIDALGRADQYSTTLRRFDVTLDGKAPTADILRYRNAGIVLITGVKVFRTSTAPKSLGLRTELVGDARYNGSGVRVFGTAQTFPLS